MRICFAAVITKPSSTVCFRLRRIYSVLLLYCSLLAALPAAVITPTLQTIRFWRSEGQAELSLIVDKQPLHKVLAIVAAQSGTTLHYAGLPEQLVSIKCVGADLKAILNCLLSQQNNVVYRYRSGDKNRLSPLEVWVLPGEGDRSSANLSSGTTVQLETTQLNNAPTPADRTEILLQQAKQTQLRAQAIAELANESPKADAKVHKMLQQALKDENPEVRAQAVFALAKREGDAAQPELMQALEDANPEVRMMVVDNSGNDSVLLAKATGDEDPLVRQMATGKLAALQNSGKF